MTTTHDNTRLTCPGCGAQNSLAHSFCQTCGRPLTGGTPVPGTVAAPPVEAGRIACPSCNKQTPGGFPFCQYCGKRLSEAGAPQHETLVSADLPPTPEPLAAPEPWGFLCEVEATGHDGARHALAAPQVLVGRGGDIALEDPYLAHWHLRLEKAPDGCRVVPLEARNGVFARVLSRSTLANGDLLLLGSELFLFERIEDDDREAAPLSSHGMTLFGTPARRSWGRLTELAETGATGDIRHLAGPEVVIGRESGDLTFPDDDCMSRRHAQLAFDESDVTLTDLGSANGSFVRVREPRVLPAGSMLRLGLRLFRIDL